MPTYTTAARVASMLMYTEISGNDQIRLVFDADSLPTLTEVNEQIDEIEAYIDEYVEQSWKTNSVTDEYHDFISKQVRGDYIDRAGYNVYEIQTDKKPLQVITSSHKIEGYRGSGSGWFDFVESGTLGEAMYQDDYYVDYKYSRIYLFNQWPIEGKNTVRITYDYGALTVPAGIKYATTLLVSAQINERRELFLNSSKDISPALNQAEQWRERAMKLLDEYRINMVEVI